MTTSEQVTGEPERERLRRGLFNTIGETTVKAAMSAVFGFGWAVLAWRYIGPYAPHRYDFTSPGFSLTQSLELLAHSLSRMLGWFGLHTATQSLWVWGAVGAIFFASLSVVATVAGAVYRHLEEHGCARLPEPGDGKIAPFVMACLGAAVASGIAAPAEVPTRFPVAPVIVGTAVGLAALAAARLAKRLGITAWASRLLQVPAEDLSEASSEPEPADRASAVSV